MVSRKRLTCVIYAKKGAFIGCLMGPVGRKCSEAFQEADAEKQKDVRSQGSASVVSALQDSWTSVLPLRVSIRHFCLQRGVLGQAKQLHGLGVYVISAQVSMGAGRRPFQFRFPPGNWKNQPSVLVQ